MITNGAKVIVGALCTLPTDPKDGLLPACVAHCPVVFDPCRCGVENAQVKSAAAPVVCSRAIVPDNDHFLGTLKVSDGANMSLSTVLFSPFPVWPSDNPHPNTFHHEPATSWGNSANPRNCVAFHNSRHAKAWPLLYINETFLEMALTKLICTFTYNGNCGLVSKVTVQGSHFL